MTNYARIIADLADDRDTSLTCGCTPDASGFGYCGECCRKLRAKIWAEMSDKKKDYDRYVDPALDDIEPYDGCSCHINPPCSYCISKNSEEA